jgi:hypothetical protein
MRSSDALEQPGDKATADEKSTRHESSDLQHPQSKGQWHMAQPGLWVADQSWQQHQHEDGEEVFDYQPADRDMAGWCVQVVVVRQHPHQDHGAGHR